MNDKKGNILYVLHSGTVGGTFDTTFDLIKNINLNFNIYILGAEEDYLILYDFSNDKINILNKFPRDKQWSAKIFHDSWLNYIYYEILTEYDINLVHIMHLINHSFDLPQLAKKLGISVLLSFHDYYFICPNYFLLNENYEYCSGICSDNNKNCKITWDLFDNMHFKTFLPIWRKEVQELFKHVDFFISSSVIVKNLFLSIYPNSINDDNFIIIEHGRDFQDLDQKLFFPPSENNPLRIAFPANQLNEMKGLDIIKNIKKLDHDNNFEFHFLGNVSENMDSYGIHHGVYVREDFKKVISEIKPSFIGIFSICPETYCHTITESWSCGIPVIGTDIGVIEDRIKKTDGGIIINRYDVKKSYEVLMNLRRMPYNEYEKLTNKVYKIYFKTTREMSDEYCKIYKNLLKSN